MHEIDLGMDRDRNCCLNAAVFIISGASVDTIDTLLGLGFLAFLFAKSLFG